MSFYSFGRIKIINKSDHKSAVATAAYHSGTRIKNEYDGMVHDFSKKKYVKETYIRMPAGVPEKWVDEKVPAKERMAIIWNDIEKTHTAANSRLARYNYIALPHDLTVRQGLECVDKFFDEYCIKKGMGVTYTLHDEPNNRHVDIMYLIGEYDKNGKPKQRFRKEYLVRNSEGSECWMKPEEFKNSEGYEKVYKYTDGEKNYKLTPSEAAIKGDELTRVNKHPVDRRIEVSGWDDELDLATEWRTGWAKILNDTYATLGSEERVDHRSYKEQGKAKLATEHVGWRADKEERIQKNQEIIKFNQVLENMRKEGEEAIKDIDDQLDDLMNNEQTEESLSEHEIRWRRNSYILLAFTENELVDKNIGEKFKATINKLDKIIHDILRDFMIMISNAKKSIEDRLTINKRAEEAKKINRSQSGNLDEMINNVLNNYDALAQQSQAMQRLGMNSLDFIVDSKPKKKTYKYPGQGKHKKGVNQWQK